MAIFSPDPSISIRNILLFIIIILLCKKKYYIKVKPQEITAERIQSHTLVGAGILEYFLVVYDRLVSPLQLGLVYDHALGQVRDAPHIRGGYTTNPHAAWYDVGDLANIGQLFPVTMFSLSAVTLVDEQVHGVVLLDEKEQKVLRDDGAARDKCSVLEHHWGGHGWR